MTLGGPAPFAATWLPKPRRRQLLVLAGAAIALAAYPSSTFAERYELRVVVGDDSEPTREILHAFTTRYPAAKIAFDPRTLIERKGQAVFVAIGPAALQSALAIDLPGPLLALFTSAEAYARLVAAARPARRDNATALFAEASPAHQLRLARALYKRRIVVAALLGPGTAHLQPLLEQAARAADVELVVRQLEASDNVVRALSAIRDAQALLMVPDRDLYTPETLRDVLETAYRHAQGVLGFSAPLVRAGALAAAYSTIDDVLAQLGPAVDELASARTLPPQYPAYWHVVVNDRVAHSLDIVVTDADRALGNPPPSP